MLGTYSGGVVYYFAGQLAHLTRWGSAEKIRVKTLIMSLFSHKYLHPLYRYYTGNTLL